MFGLGVWEIILILVTALVVLGPQKLPQVARQLARLLGELKRISEDVRRNVDEVLAEPDEAPAPHGPVAGADAAASGTVQPPRPPGGLPAGVQPSTPPGHAPNAVAPKPTSGGAHPAPHPGEP
jgi:Tat protein translocase TatB subunit